MSAGLSHCPSGTSDGNASPLGGEDNFSLIPPMAILAAERDFASHRHVDRVWNRSARSQGCANRDPADGPSLWIAHSGSASGISRGAIGILRPNEFAPNATGIKIIVRCRILHTSRVCAASGVLCLPSALLPSPAQQLRQLRSRHRRMVSSDYCAFQPNFTVFQSCPALAIAAVISRQRSRRRGYHLRANLARDALESRAPDWPPLHWCSAETPISFVWKLRFLRSGRSLRVPVSPGIDWRFQFFLSV